MCVKTQFAIVNFHCELLDNIVNQIYHAICCDKREKKRNVLKNIIQNFRHKVDISISNEIQNFE